MQPRAAFLDLNGTLVTPIKVEAPELYTPIPGALEAVAFLNDAGFLCPVITVQSRIAKKFYSEATFRCWFTSFSQHAAEFGASFAGLYICPHRFHSGCLCGKPNSDLYRQAARDHVIDCSQSYVVGDSVDDMEVAQRMRMKGCLVLTGQGAVAAETLRTPPASIGADLRAVAEWIVAFPQ